MYALIIIFFPCLQEAFDVYSNLLDEQNIPGWRSTLGIVDIQAQRVMYSLESYSYNVSARNNHSARNVLNRNSLGTYVCTYELCRMVYRMIYVHTRGGGKGLSPRS